MKKRLLSALMAASMVLTMVPPAFAADPSNTDITDAQSLQNALNAAGQGGWVEVKDALDLQGTPVTVPAGVGLNAGKYNITGTVKAQAGSSVYALTDDTTRQYIIGEETLNLTSGTATVDFAKGTTTTIDEGATAEIAGPYMNNEGKKDFTYRLPKADQLIVNGDLAVKHDMTAVGKLTVNGSVNVENGNSLTLKKMKTEDDTVRMDVAESGSVTVKNGATLDVGGYYAQGKVTAEAGATVEVWDITQWGEDEYQMIGQNSLNITAGTVEVNFGEGTTTTITKDSEATIAGFFMDDSSKNAYRIPKADQMIVDGKLNVSYPMEVSGTVAVNGETVIANGGSLELVRLLSGSYAGTLTIAGAAQLLVQSGATLKGTNGTVNGAIHKESGATVEVPEDVDVYEIFTVTFDANEGTFADGTATKSANTDWDGRLNAEDVSALQPAKGSAQFTGWSFADNTLFAEANYGTYAFTADTTLKAVWDESTAGEAEVSPAPPAVAEPELPDATEEEKDTANAMKTALETATELVATNSLTDAAKSVAENNTVTVEDGKAALVENGVTVNEGETVTIVVQPYMDIAITDVTINEDGSKTLTLDITPMYRTVATTATSTSDIELGETGKNAVEL